MTSMTSITRVGSKAKKSLRGWRGGGVWIFPGSTHYRQPVFSSEVSIVCRGHYLIYVGLSAEARGEFVDGL